MCARSVLPLLLPLACLSCTSLGQRVHESRIAAAFEEDVRELSPECVSLHDRIEYLSADQENSCGVACLDMILRFEGADLPPSIRRDLRDHVAREGSLRQDRIRESLQSAGFLSIHLQGTWTWPDDAGEVDLLAWQDPAVHLRQGRPVILRLETSEGRHHFVLLVGYDPVERKLVVISPGRGKEVWPESALGAWERAGRWFIAYKRPERLGRSEARRRET